MLCLLFVGSLFAQTAAPAKKSWALPNMDSLYRGKPYVDFSLKSLAGELYNNNNCKGSVTLLFFWFESCVGCREEFREVNEFYDSLKNDKGVRLIAVTFENERELPGFIDKYHLKYPIATTGDMDKFAKLKYGMGCPSSIVLDKDGKIAFIDMKALTRTGGTRDFTIPNVIAKVRAME